MKILSFVADIFEDLELWYPLIRLKEEGWEVDVVALDKAKTYVGKYGLKAQANKTYDEVDSKDYDGLLIPGGYAPDILRVEEDCIRLTQEFNAQGKPIGMICHAGWVPVTADILRGKTGTSTRKIKADLEGAGLTWVDEEVVVSENIISSRSPKDLHVYTTAFIDEVKKYKEKNQG
ncbi:type 1 glutamine amidotransferase [Proteiniclasticum sp. BAD-10]|uniref:Type 1 glutamine amidotransferase n=1 Tax=Proteiniclasticum sediminis TaxID=2804028 RepID=A0A941CNX4_9CLOT|nr:type 1 glutamine amidotransferase domain-containing protein [Proteiniclasticum sediminis]MBR0576185.1 type 1 glutamine amidotransferase [Proteiniclasticum sediminis]